MKYDHTSLEPKWQKVWEEENLYAADDNSDAEKFYVLDMFPYPSGAGLHVGHPEGYTATDIVSRKARMEGKNVLHPMGWDAFGLPAENYAIKTGTPPAESTAKNIETFTRQIKSLGFSYDWSRELATTDPEYFRWTQWWFLFLFERGLAYQKEAAVNWCDSCQTVLANEQVVNGKCERCDSEVKQKKMKQWFFKITDFIESDEKTSGLLDGLDKIDWPESTKTGQRNWIGKSTGAEVDFAIETKPAKAIIIHGFDGHENENWFPWLKAELEQKGFEVRVPTWPNSAHPDFENVMEFLEKETEDFGENDVVVGHSLGGYFAMRLAEKKKFAKLVLVASAIANLNDKQIQIAAEKGGDVDALQKTIGHGFDLAKIATPSKIAFFSEDDPWIPFADRELLDASWQIETFANRGHFNQAEMPEALAAIAPKLTVFTTRPDTLFGATFMVVAPEHELLAREKSRITNLAEVENYVAESLKKTELQRQQDEKEKTGVRVEGLSAVNPVNGEAIPIFVADYVLAGYGTGAIMAVPAHDERDFAFAKKFGIEIREVVSPENYIFNTEKENLKDGWRAGILKLSAEEDIQVDDSKKIVEIKINPREFDKFLEWSKEFLIDSRDTAEVAQLQEIECFSGEGIAINSGEFDGLPTAEVKEKIIARLETDGSGRARTTYKLRDWLVSRQRFWGAPIPIVHCPDCGAVPVAEKDLPIELPTDVDFRPTGESPLASSTEFHADVTCPKCGQPARREVDTMDTFVCSSWYYFRYADPRNAEAFAGETALKKWLPVDLYVGGAEHTVLHLLYSRFFTKAAHRAGLLDFDEPFLKLRHQGMILGEDSQKMSKSKGNVINPDDVVREFGADTLRLYEMFMGPFEGSCPWSTEGVAGVRRFLEKVWRLAEKIDDSADSPELTKSLHKTIKKVTHDIDTFGFNTAIAAMMIFVNEVGKLDKISRDTFEKFVTILAPFAPHLTEEIWREILGHKNSIHRESWPTFDENLAKDDTVTLAIQVNGKLRDTLEVAADIAKDDALAAAKSSEKIAKWLDGKEIRKEIFVPGKLVNFVVA